MRQSQNFSITCVLALALGACASTPATGPVLASTVHCYNKAGDLALTIGRYAKDRAVIVQMNAGITSQYVEERVGPDTRFKLEANEALQWILEPSGRIGFTDFTGTRSGEMVEAKPVLYCKL